MGQKPSYIDHPQISSVLMRIMFRSVLLHARNKHTESGPPLSINAAQCSWHWQLKFPSSTSNNQSCPLLHRSTHLASLLSLYFTTLLLSLPAEAGFDETQGDKICTYFKRGSHHLEGLIEGQQQGGDTFSGFEFGQPKSAAFGIATNMEDPHCTKPLPEFAIDYGHDVVAHDAKERQITLTYDNRGGARWRTNVKFESGTFSVRIKTPEGDTSGLNTSFYLSSLEGDKSQDEIDFEFLGKDKGIVQTNYYTIGTGCREETHQLGFDSSAEFHEYTLRWLPSKIEWLIDGKLVRTAEKKDGEAWPGKPMYLYASIWNAGYIDEGKWAGCYSGAHEPYDSIYRDVHVPVNHSESNLLLLMFDLGFFTLCHAGSLVINPMQRLFHQILFDEMQTSLREAKKSLSSYYVRSTGRRLEEGWMASTMMSLRSLWDEGELPLQGLFRKE
jgi:hypothetical protein